MSNAAAPASQPALTARRAAAALAGYALVPLHPVLAAREAANAQQRVSREVRHGR